MITKEISSNHLGSIIVWAAAPVYWGKLRHCVKISKGLIWEDACGGEKKNLYNKLIKQDIETFLLTYPLSFDYFVALTSSYTLETTQRSSDQSKLATHLGASCCSQLRTAMEAVFSERSGRYSHSKDISNALLEGLDTTYAASKNISSAKTGTITSLAGYTCWF